MIPAALAAVLIAVLVPAADVSAQDGGAPEAPAGPSLRAVRVGILPGPAEGWVAVRAEVVHRGPAMAVEFRAEGLSRSGRVRGVGRRTLDLPAADPLQPVVRPATVMLLLHAAGAEMVTEATVRVSLTPAGADGSSATATVNLDEFTPDSDPRLVRLSAEPWVPGAMGEARGILNHLTVVPMNAADAPRRPEAWDSVDLVWVHRLTARDLAPEALEALVTWVREGGMVVLVAGDEPGWTRSTLPGRLLGPDAPVLERFRGRVPDEGERARALRNGDDGGPLVVIAPDGDVPLVLPAKPLSAPFTPVLGAPRGPQADSREARALLWKRRLGRGRVWVLGTDPEALDRVSAGVITWAVFNRVWAEAGDGPLWQVKGVPLHRRPTDAAGRRPANDQRARRGGLVEALRWDTRPDGGPLTLLIVAYVLTIGPVNFLVLRRIGRPEWSVATIPLVVALFVALVLGYGYARKGMNTLLQGVAVVTPLGEPLAEGPVPAHETGLVGLFAGTTGTWDTALPEGALGHPLVATADDWHSLRTELVQDGPRPVVTGRPQVLWQNHAVRWDRVITLEAPAEVRSAGPDVLEVVNRTGHVLTRPAVWLRFADQLMVGPETLAPGATAQLRPPAAGEGESSVTAAVRRVLGPDALDLQARPVPILRDGRDSARAVLLARLPAAPEDMPRLHAADGRPVAPAEAAPDRWARLLWQPLPDLEGPR